MREPEAYPVPCVRKGRVFVTSATGNEVAGHVRNGRLRYQEVLINVGPRQRGAARARQGRAMKPHSLCGESL